MMRIINLLLLLLFSFGSISQEIDVYFELNDTKIINEKEPEWLKIKSNDYPKGSKISLVGYTDTLGQIDKNVQLAKKRLEEVLKTIDTSHFRVSYSVVGESTLKSPIELNRRVAIFISPEVNIPSENHVNDLLSNEMVEEIKLEDTLILKIQFLPGTAVLQDYSYPEIDRLYVFLNERTSVSVELHGHVCCSSSYELSLQRANTVKRILVSKGIALERIKTFSHSNTQPRYVEDSEIHQQGNRRVECVFY